MKNSKIVTVLAATLLAMGLASASEAQERQAPEGIETITIVAKRPDPALAAACVNEVRATADLHNSQEHMDRMAMRRAIRHCMEQGTVTGNAQI